MPVNKQGSAQLICKDDGVICGLDVFFRTFRLLDDTARFDCAVQDGDRVHMVQVRGTLYGDIKAILSGERTALNYLQRMSGIASITREYMDELTGGRGIIFATGTPVSNSMTELYTNMRYLQYGTLQKLGLGHFDAWAASFGETQTAIELAPEGTGYRAKTRFAKFFNLPEQIALFKVSAYIHKPEMLTLTLP